MHRRIKEEKHISKFLQTQEEEFATSAQSAFSQRQMIEKGVATSVRCALLRGYDFVGLRKLTFPF